MLKKLLISTFVLSMMAGCGSKKTDEGDSAANMKPTTEDAVEAKPLSFDPMGSDSGNIPGLSSIHFEYDKANLTADSKGKLKQNAQWMKDNPKVNVQIEGHCDARGSIEYNLALGERRAKAAQSYVQSLGVEAGRLSIISYGKEKPIATGDTEAAYTKNRRANFVPLQ